MTFLEQIAALLDAAKMRAWAEPLEDVGEDCDPYECPVSRYLHDQTGYHWYVTITRAWPIASEAPADAQIIPHEQWLERVVHAVDHSTHPTVREAFLAALEKEIKL